MKQRVLNTSGKVSYMRWYVRAATVALLMGAMLCSTAFAASPDRSGFSAMQGIDAQALSVQEMQSISGELNAYDIAAALTADAAKLDKYPKLQAATLKAAEWTKANAEKINAAFLKLHILTPCKSCS